MYAFCEGLKTLGVLEKMRRHPDSFRPLFCYEPHMLTADQVDDLFTFIYLQKEKILAFATGATAVPPIGFSPAPSIEFIHRGDDDFSSTQFSLLPTRVLTALGCHCMFHTIRLKPSTQPCRTKRHLINLWLPSKCLLRDQKALLQSTCLFIYLVVNS
uniref:HECT domain-containing protein n=1 Tax=Maylandia zebra TaxID=106582 RepID=A0A3P9DI97_9CICH